MSRRQSHCFVPGCKSGYKSCKEKLSLFGVPKEEQVFQQWQRNIPRADRPLERNAAVCELHFDKQFVSRHFEHTIDGKTVRLERTRPVLLPGAAPTIFPNVPSYLSKPVPRKRNPKERLCPPLAVPEKRQRMSNVLQPLPGEESDESATATSMPRLPFNHKDIALPSDNWGKHVFSGVPLKVAYSVCLPGPDMSLLCAEKLVLFTVTGDTVTNEVFVRGVKLVLDEPGDPTSTLQAVDSMHVCSGAGFVEEFPFACCNSNLTVWNGSLYNKKCIGTSLERCVACKYLQRILINQRCRRKKTQAKRNVSRKAEAKTQAVRRLKAKVKALDEIISQMKAENAKIEEVALLRKIDNLPPKQKAAILQCFEAASRKSLKGMRYSSEWVLECVIMRIKSPRLYEHVRREKILMLPIRTCLRNFMKTYESSFGFNSSVLSGIAKKKPNKWMSFSATAVS
ncbi:hypothetical protein HPB49_010630 [Dermacentor silvarum]|uniref:Uncharacterized protein n=1 Tax=Dermacentor silvarum TaxID=543639 RepID=A0ACB8D4T3_DERSI|nr:hypothetical protein HPB49_010630 [Dermacentor silvarum]